MASDGVSSEMMKGAKRFHAILKDFATIEKELVGGYPVRNLPTPVSTK
jgi:hypothetical protein